MQLPIIYVLGLRGTPSPPTRTLLRSPLPVVGLEGGTDPPEVAGDTALESAKFYRPPLRNVATMKCEWALRITILRARQPPLSVFWPAVQVLQLSVRLTLDSWSKIVIYKFVEFCVENHSYFFLNKLFTAGFLHVCHFLPLPGACPSHEHRPPFRLHVNSLNFSEPPALFRASLTCSEPR